MTPWLPLARAGADSIIGANRADRCQKVWPLALGTSPTELPAPNRPIGTGIPSGIMSTEPPIPSSAYLQADPAEVVLRGELDEIEQGCLP